MNLMMLLYCLVLQSILYQNVKSKEIIIPTLPLIQELPPPSFVPSYNRTKIENTCTPYGYAQSILWMDVQWILQGYNIQFQGFFVEFLGFAESFVKLIPHGRLVKSSFFRSFQEIPIPNHHRFLDIDLFPKERDLIYWLILKSYPANLLLSSSSSESSEEESAEADSTYSEDHPRPQHRTIPFIHDFPKSMFPEINSTASCEDSSLTEQLWTNNKEIDDLNQTSRSLFYESSSTKQCCLHCLADTLCTQWSYDKVKQQCTFSGLTASNPLSSVHYLPNPHSVSGKIGVRTMDGTSIRFRQSKPKAFIFHGTTCIFRNSTSTYLRDVNTIYIGRYMLERAVFSKGLTIDEYAVSYCSGLMDEIWVPTQWHKDIFEKFLSMQGTSHPVISIIPEAVDTTLFIPSYLRNRQQQLSVEVSATQNGGSALSPSDEYDPVLHHHTIKKKCQILAETNQVTCLTSEHQFEFLSIFKWEYRKGWDILLEAFWNAFTIADQVVLRLRTYLPRSEHGNRNITQQIQEYAEKKLGKALHELPRVIWETGSNSELDSEALTREQMRDLLETADAFVLPTRGEGWGLPIAEAMAMELPVIITNATGILAYGRSDNAYLIPVESKLDHLSFVIPRKEVLQQLFRDVIEEYTAEHNYRALNIAKNARKKMEEFSPDLIVCQMNERLRFQAKRRGWFV